MDGDSNKPIPEGGSAAPSNSTEKDVDMEGAGKGAPVLTQDASFGKSRASGGMK